MSWDIVLRNIIKVIHLTKGWKHMKRKWIAFLAAVSLVCSAALPAFSVLAAESDATIRIVHTNDIHGYYTATGRGQIGFAALKALIDEQDADLVLDAGDTFHGQAFATVEQGQSIAALMRAVGYDAVTPGNHDWSYGCERLRELGEQNDLPILAANVERQDGTAFFDIPYLVKDVIADNGEPLRVGVLGVIDDSFYTSTPPHNVQGIRFTEEAESATRTASVLREDEGCDIVIALTHQADCAGFVSQISGIDAVIAGHEHKCFDDVFQDADGNPVHIVEAGYYFQNVGVLSLTYDVQSGTVETAKTEDTCLSAADIQGLSDPAIEALIGELEQGQQAILDRTVGESSREYAYSWEEIRIREQEIGRIVTAAYRAATGADIAIENAGGIRGGLPQGQITYRDVIQISPYGNTIVVCKLTGAQILEVVEHSLSISMACDAVYEIQKEAVAAGEDPYQYAWPDNSGSALQFGGLQVEYDPSAQDGARVRSIRVNGEDLNPECTYTVATNSYVVSDSEYPAIVGAQMLYEYGTCEQALIQFIQTGDFESAAAQPGVTAIAEGTQQPGADEKPETPELPGNPAQPDTGDPAMPAVILVAGSAAAVLVILRRRRVSR